MFVHLTPKERLGYASLVGLLLFGFGYVGAQQLRKPAPIVFESQDKANMELSGQREGEGKSTPAQAQAPTSSSVVVHVAGSVVKPGIVTLDANARVADAIEAAGGAKADADLDSINLAAKLVDGSQLRVPSRNKPTPIGTAPAPSRELPPLRVEFPPDVEPRYLAQPSPEPQRGPSSSEPSYASEPAPRPAVPQPSASAPASGGIVYVNTASAKELESLPGIGPVLAQRILEYRQRHGPFPSVDALQAVSGIGPKRLEAIRPFVRL